MTDGCKINLTKSEVIEKIPFSKALADEAFVFIIKQVSSELTKQGGTTIGKHWSNQNYSDSMVRDILFSIEAEFVSKGWLLSADDDYIYIESRD